MAKKIVLFILGYFVWLGLVGFVGMNFLDKALAGKSSPFTDSTGSIVFLIGALIVFGAPIIIFLLWFYHTPKWEKDLQETGTLAQALVLEVKNTGVYTGSRYSGTPWWRVTLQVKPTSDMPFEVVLEKPSDQFFMVHQGSTVNVKYDPNNKKHVVLVKPEIQFASNTSFAHSKFEIPPTSYKQPSASNVGQQLIELAILHKQGELTDLEFEAAKKKLLS